MKFLEYDEFGYRPQVTEQVVRDVIKKFLDNKENNRNLLSKLMYRIETGYIYGKVEDDKQYMYANHIIIRDEDNNKTICRLEFNSKEVAVNLDKYGMKAEEFVTVMLSTNYTKEEIENGDNIYLYSLKDKVPFINGLGERYYNFGTYLMEDKDKLPIIIFNKINELFFSSIHSKYLAKVNFMEELREKYKEYIN